MMRSFRFLAAAAALFSSIVAARASTPALKVPAACHPVSLAALHLTWISSAVYVPSLRKILLVESARNRLLLLDEDGNPTALNNPPPEELARLSPALVSATPDGFVLKLVTSAIFQFDKGLHLRSAAPKSLAAASDRRPTLGSVSQMTVEDHSIVAYGSLRSPSFQRGFERGFLRASLTGGSDPEMLLRFEESGYYLIGYQYLASIGSTAYFLRMGDQATLFKVPAGARRPVARTGAVPPQFRLVPKLQTHMDGPADVPARFAEVEGLTIPAGLYGGPDGFLYLLTRQPAKSSAGTDWWLHRLTPEGDRILGSGRLPTSARHLTVVPSPDRWFLIERGEVDSNGHQSIESMIAVPSSSLTRMTASGTAICP